MLASIVGEGEISSIEKSYLSFGKKFEKEFLKQGEFENRSLEESYKICWSLLENIPKSELLRLKEKDIKEFLNE